MTFQATYNPELQYVYAYGLKTDKAQTNGGTVTDSRNTTLGAFINKWNNDLAFSIVIMEMIGMN